MFWLWPGRTATHVLCDIMAAHPCIAATVEKPPAFTWVVDLAMQPGKMDPLFPRLVRRYRYEHADIAPRHFLDKSPPSLCIAEAPAEAFPDAMFDAIRRAVVGPVNRQPQHRAALGWTHGRTLFRRPTPLPSQTP